MIAFVAILTALASASFIAAHPSDPQPSGGNPPLLFELDVQPQAGLYVQSSNAEGGSWGGCGGYFTFDFNNQYIAEPFEMRLYKTDDLGCTGTPTAKAQCTVHVPSQIPTTPEWVILQTQAPWVDVLPGEAVRKLSIACATPTP